MAEILNFFIDALQDQFMHPARFIREINKRSNLQVILNEPIQTADAIEIIHWNRWENGNLNNKYSLIMRAGQYVDWNYIPEIEHITAVTETENWQGDIQDISCLGASKSDLRLFKSLDDFAIEINSTLIAELSEENLKKNLLWENGRILDYAFFHCHGWDNNLIHLCNSGGSHHFSAESLRKQKEQDSTLDN